MPYKPIRCERYDYIEIVCIRHYRLDIKLVSGEVISDVIANTTHIQNREEFLVVITNQDADKHEQKIRLDKIETMTVLNQNAEFKTVSIRDLSITQ